MNVNAIQLEGAILAHWQILLIGSLANMYHMSKLKVIEYCKN